MYSDPVVEEVRRNGAKLAEECAGDVHRMAERLRQGAETSGRRIIRRKAPPAQPPPPCGPGAR